MHHGPFPLVASALLDLLLDAWAVEREREKAKDDDDEPAAAENGDAASKPVARAFDLIDELRRQQRSTSDFVLELVDRVKAIEAARRPDPGA